MQMTCALEPRGQNRPGARSRPSRWPSPRETRPRAGAREEGTRLSQHRGPRCLDRRTQTVPGPGWAVTGVWLRQQERPAPREGQSCPEIRLPALPESRGETPGGPHAYPRSRGAARQSGLPAARCPAVMGRKGEEPRTPRQHRQRPAVAR